MNLINEEMKRAKAGKEAWIRLKLNNLVDTGMIEKLYRASLAGVQIQLVVRGICALKAGVPGLSENIEVRSVVVGSQINRFHVMDSPHHTPMSNTHSATAHTPPTPGRGSRSEAVTGCSEW